MADLTHFFLVHLLYIKNVDDHASLITLQQQRGPKFEHNVNITFLGLLIDFSIYLVYDRSNL